MERVEVAVIGAGAAGLAAAALLRSAGVEALLLEARPRIGGRAHTEHTVPGAPFDRGASYIHAAEQGNPWLDVALALGERLLLDPRRRLVLDHGRPCAWAPYGDAIESASQRLGAAVAGGRQEAAGRLLAGSTAADHYARAMIGPWLSGMDIDAMDASDFVAAREGEDWLVPQGYGRLVERFGAGLPVRLSCPANVIRCRTEEVEITTTAGVLRAGHVILTVPLGVLAAERIRFDPPLPAPVLAALEDLPMGNLVKLRVRLDGDPFGVGDNVYLNAPPASERTILWLARPFGRDELMGFVGGSLADELTALPDKDMTAEVRRQLAAMLGDGAAIRIVACTAADWRRDPWALGSYAIARPGGAAARAALRAPFAERVHYAGEAAAADGWHGTVAGAYLSGRAAARAALGAGLCRHPVTK